MDSAGFATAYGLSTSVGLRPFLVLALASLAMHLGLVHPAPAFAYLGNGGATWLLGGLALLEFAGDKVPVLDHTLHVVHFATKPIAAAILVGSALPATGSPDATTYAFMGLGALNALGIHAGVATLRGASTATTAGMANPIVSLIEDVVAIGTALLAILFPLAGVVVAVAVTIVVALVARRVYAAFRGRARGSTLAR